MAKSRRRLTAIQLKNMSILRIATMDSVSVLEKGVGIFDAEGEMIGWIETSDPTKKSLISDYLLKAINEPDEVGPPDWSFLDDADEVAQPTTTSARAGAQPFFNAKKTPETSGGAAAA